jgi:hypothetical protein
MPMSGERVRSTYSTGVAGPVAILLWRHAFTLPGVESVAAAVQDLKRKYRGQKLGFLTVIEPELEMHVTPDVRRALTAFLGSVDQDLAAAAVVYEAHGFQATIARSIVTAIGLAARASFAHRVFADMNGSLRWMAGKVAPRDATLEAALATTVAKIRAHGTAP